MSLITRCPACGTAFRAQHEQLSARGGRVRCGKCATVFEGIACLVEQAPTSGGGPVEALAPIPAAEGIPDFLLQEKPRPRYTLVWTLLALLALAALLAQAAHRFRTDLATLFPSIRSHLVAACMGLGCEVRLPRRPDLLSIDSSDLQADLKRENVLRLTALLRNRAPFAQEAPLVELTLTDEQEQAVVRRILHPTDYLGPARAADVLAQGIPAGAEVAVVLHFDASTVRATGYRLYLFHP